MINMNEYDVGMYAFKCTNLINNFLLAWLNVISHKPAMIVVTCFLLLSPCIVFGQDCKTRGETCSDDKYCCGGCCIDAICVDTTRNCHELLDLCSEHSCPGNHYCYTFTPCLGCEMQAHCRKLFS